MKRAGKRGVSDQRRSAAGGVRLGSRSLQNFEFYELMEVLQIDYIVPTGYIV